MWIKWTQLVSKGAKQLLSPFFLSIRYNIGPILCDKKWRCVTIKDASIPEDSKLKRSGYLVIPAALIFPDLRIYYLPSLTQDAEDTGKKASFLFPATLQGSEGGRSCSYTCPAGWLGPWSGTHSFPNQWFLTLSVPQTGPLWTTLYK